MGIEADPKAFEFAIGKITDGFVFENFANAFLSCVVGQTFMPVGGLKDRGIDGLEHIFHRKGAERRIYQASIEASPEQKVRSTLTKLNDNKIPFEQLTFITNQRIPKKDTLADSLFDDFKKPVNLNDASWLVSRINYAEGTRSAYRTYVLSNLHEFQKPGSGHVVSDLLKDPRLYVFLRQQWDSQRSKRELDEVLYDTLILYSLEETDPDSGMFLSREEIARGVEALLKHRPKDLEQRIQKRLKVLTQKPRRVNHHTTDDSYCLPFETRIELQERNLEDASLLESFEMEVCRRLREHLKAEGARVQDVLKLMQSAIHNLFHQQGMEFSDFVTSGQNQKAFEKNLPGIIANTVDDSAVIEKNRQAVKTALLTTIREVVYRGSPAEKEFLRRLSQTYAMLFLLQCDPNVATFFHAMASKLNVYVGTSIIIPALSEYYLEPTNRRHWNLLKGASAKGVQLTINGNILSELSAHFRYIKERFEEDYRKTEHLYTENEAAALYVDEILIRAYFYARIHDQTRSFDDFLDNFVSSDLKGASEDLVQFLQHEFGITFQDDSSLGVTLSKDDEAALYNELLKSKRSDRTARNDAQLILTLYGLRERNNEIDTGGIFGYRTWWLSKDTSTQKAANKVFRKRYSVSCYIRPDFLYNYIALTPSRDDVDDTFRGMFPSLMGVNIAFHVPTEVTAEIRKRLKEHAAKSPSRTSALTRRLSDKLKTDPNLNTKQSVRHFFDEERKKLENPAASKKKGKRSKKPLRKS